MISATTDVNVFPVFALICERFCRELQRCAIELVDHCFVLCLAGSWSWVCSMLARVEILATCFVALRVGATFCRWPGTTFCGVLWEL